MRYLNASTAAWRFLPVVLFALSGPPPVTGQFFLVESCIEYIDRDYFQVDVRGYSRTYNLDWPYFPGTPAVSSALYQESGGWIDYAWLWDVWGEEAIVDVQGSLLPRGYRYRVEGMHWFFFDTYYYIGSTEASVSVPMVAVVPWGESSYFVGMWQTDPVFQAAFNAVLWPEGYVFNGGLVFESVTGFYDDCFANSAGGPTLQLEQPSWWVVGELGDGVYGHDWVGASRSWIDYYTEKIATQQMASCGCGAVQTMSYESGWGVPTPYQVNSTSVHLDGSNVIVDRGNANASSPAP